MGVAVVEIIVQLVHEVVLRMSLPNKMAVMMSSLSVRDASELQLRVN